MFCASKPPFHHEVRNLHLAPMTGLVLHVQI
jgi:hypothetical protein